MIADKIETLDRALELERQDRPAEALALLAPEASALRSGGDPVEASIASLNEARLLLLCGDGSTSFVRVAWALAALKDERAPRRGHPRLPSLIRVLLHWTNMATLRRSVSFAMLLSGLDELAAYLQRSGQEPLLGAVLAERGSALLREGRFDEACAALREALARYRSHPAQPGMSEASALRSLADAQRRLGLDAEADASLLALAHRKDLGVRNRVQVHVSLGFSALKRKDLPSAGSHARAAREAARGQDAELGLIADGLSVEVFLALGDLDEADAAAERVAGFAHETRFPPTMAGATQDRFDVSMARGDLAAARRLLDELISLAPAADRYRNDGHYAAAARERCERLAAAEEAARSKPRKR